MPSSLTSITTFSFCLLFPIIKMKLLVFGSTGFLATEVIRRALSNPSITSLITIGRRELPPPVTSSLLPEADLSKLESVTVDFDSPTAYDAEPIRTHIKNADACIWTIAVTPSRLGSVPWETTVKVCHDYTVTFLNSLLEIKTGKSGFKFVYVSGHNAQQDQTKKPLILGDYCLLRGRTENEILKLAEGNPGRLEVCIARPGIIEGRPGSGKETGMLQGMFFGLIGLPKVRVEEAGGALIEGVVAEEFEFEKGREDERVWRNEDLVRIGQEVVGKKVRAKTTVSRMVSVVMSMPIGSTAL
ncbi:hypothetical protein QBC44DRAFT_314771 [Cladorrhinum sp. PSN332]|nr:hypothetical protein QBC44DRAFT_314771 [Cladorrhinum sp. PSN332]